ncbi:arylsulfatase [Puniceicoccus vermicola]|uniref:Arylsulfatase n=1 Tax=Puniceicoccus vermicola TaxID=388746 RepID=A0A7X1AZR7_9BACT|nr:arylsulfatase [Puniceicoccus vermicola]MBC2602971.1 arylsulfatase [Puniceicoccus vermicola]
MTKPSSPNIVFIHVDQWRADCLSIEGHPVVHTPTLDLLALQGVLFSHAYASCPTCVPSRASLMTGLTPEHHGRVSYQDGVPWNYPITLPGEFTKCGYQTKAIGKLHTFPERNQLGFESVELHDGYLHFARKRHGQPIENDDYLAWLREETGRANADYFEHGVNCNSIVARPWPMEEYLHPTNWVTSRSLDFLDTRDTSRPFFLYMSYHRPHPPYDPPGWALDQYLQAPMPDPVVGDWVDLYEPYDQSHSPEAFRAKYRPDILQRARAGYYGHLTHIDHQINRFLEILQEYDLAENTWIVFTSDHGEMLGDHHLYRKGYPYEASARVPLIVKPPQSVEYPKGSVCETVVEMMDFLPTLLDCAGLPAPDQIDGRSFLNHVVGKSQASLRPYLHGEHTLFGYSLQWLTDGREKYVWHSGTGREQLFDLSDDPNEVKDLSLNASPLAVERLAVWRQRMVDTLRHREEGFVSADGALLPGRPVSPILQHLRNA